MITIHEILCKLDKTDLQISSHQIPLRYFGANFVIPNMIPQSNLLYICKTSEFNPAWLNYSQTGFLLVQDTTSFDISISNSQCEFVLWDEPIVLEQLFYKVQSIITTAFEQNNIHSILYESLRQIEENRVSFFLKRIRL